jgi:hypothetical protein
VIRPTPLSSPGKLRIFATNAFLETLAERGSDRTGAAKKGCFLCGTDGSNPSFSSGQSLSRPQLIQENASPDVRRDLGAFLHRIVPENIALYRHNDEGPDDMSAHIKSALTQTQLGTWQGIFLLEHRGSPHCRALILNFIGEEEEPARRSGERHCSG